MQEGLANRPLKGGHRGSQLGAHSAPLAGIALTRERFGDPLDERETPICKPELPQQLGHLRYVRLGICDPFTSALYALHAPTYVLQQPAFERAATLRPMLVDAAPCPLQRQAGLRHHRAVRVVRLDVQPQDLHRRDLATRELDVGE